ncbi:MAG: hypothetical protein ABIU95_11500, partial [Burkholderiales bacterium]
DSFVSVSEDEFDRLAKLLIGVKTRADVESHLGQPSESMPISEPEEIRVALGMGEDAPKPIATMCYTRLSTAAVLHFTVFDDQSIEGAVLPDHARGEFAVASRLEHQYDRVVTRL